MVTYKHVFYEKTNTHVKLDNNSHYIPATESILCSSIWKNVAIVIFVSDENMIKIETK